MIKVVRFNLFETPEFSIKKESDEWSYDDINYIANQLIKIVRKSPVLSINYKGMGYTYKPTDYERKVSHPVWVHYSNNPKGAHMIFEIEIEIKCGKIPRKKNLQNIKDWLIMEII
jgi:hypothetical protein